MPSPNPSPSSSIFLRYVTSEGPIWRALSLACAIIGAAIVVSIILAVANHAPGLRNVFSLSEVSQTPRRLLGEIHVMATLAVVLCLVAALALQFASWMYHRPAASFLWPDRKPSVRLLLIGAAVSAPTTTIILFPASAMMGEPLLFPVLDAGYQLTHRIYYAAAAVFALLVAALAEEVLFRGLVLQATAAFTRRVTLICLINGVLFAAFHMYADPVVFASLAIAGALWAWLTLELGGIEFATGAHVAHNLCIGLLAAPFSESIDAAPRCRR